MPVNQSVIPFRVGDIITPKLGLPREIYSQRNVSCIRGVLYKVIGLTPFTVKFMRIPDDARPNSYDVPYFRTQYIGSNWWVQPDWYTLVNASKNNLSIFN